MKIGFVFTNYNNAEITRNAVQSIFTCTKSCDAHVVVVDNRSEHGDVKALKDLEKDYPSIKVIYNTENVGYFNGLNVGIRYLRGKFSDVEVIVVGNNDLTFSADFIENVQRCDGLCKYGVISPDIITMYGEHQNPHVLSDISIVREFIWDLYYSNYFVAIFINYLAGVSHRFTQRTDFHQFEIPRRVTQGYGACYILGPMFFKHFEKLWAPTLLMGEEFFLAEQLSRKGLYVFYDPSLKVYHHDHATMGKLPGKELWKHAKEAHRIYRQFVRPFWILGSRLRLDVPEGK